MRPDYCPVGNEPCQSLCDTPCTILPKREWVGLTDEEIGSITGKVIGWNSACGWEEDFARAIEAKLKEKNT